MRFALVILLLALPLSLTLTSMPVWAANPADAALAQALFTSGKDAMARGDLPTACARFSESLKLDPGVGTLLNLATCEDRSGKLAIALEHFTSARTQLPKDDFRIAFATERIASLSQRVARIVVRSPAPGQPGARPPGTKVLRDGVEIEPSAFNAPIFVDPGAHVVSVETSGGQPPERTEIMLREGEEKVIDLGPKTTPPTAVTAPSSDASDKNKASGASPTHPEGEDTGMSTRTTLGFVTGGVAVAGLVTGAVTGLIAVNAASTYRSHCTNGECDPDGLSAAETGRSVRVVSPVSFAIGGVFGIASVYLFLSGRSARSARSAPSAPSASPPKAIQITPTASPSSAGFSLVGSF